MSFSHFPEAFLVCVFVFFMISKKNQPQPLNSFDVLIRSTRLSLSFFLCSRQNHFARLNKFLCVGGGGKIYSRHKIQLISIVADKNEYFIMLIHYQ